MRIQPKIYAKTLIESLDSGKSVKEIAKRFWYLLQKNNQYKSLSEVLAHLDREYAKKHDLILAEVISGTKLSAAQQESLQEKLVSRYHKKILLKSIIKPEIKAGVVVKVDDQEIDMSLDSKIKKLKQKLTAS